MGMMTGSGECYTGDCDHDEHLTSGEKIFRLRELLEVARDADPSTRVMGSPWHLRAQKVLRETK